MPLAKNLQGIGNLGRACCGIDGASNLGVNEGASGFKWFSGEIVTFGSASLRDTVPVIAEKVALGADA
jgi:hypothetical protein